MKARKFKVVGTTIDGKSVVTGMFEFIDRFGFPTEMFCLECKDRGFVPDWLNFYSEACKAGWSYVRTIAHIREGASVWGADWADHITKRIDSIKEVRDGKTKNKKRLE